MVSSECMEGLQLLRDCSVYQQCVLEENGNEIQTPQKKNHDTGCRTSVAINNATVHQHFTMVSPNSNLPIVVLQAEVGVVSKQNVIPLCCPCHTIDGSSTFGFQSRVCETMDALRTFHSAANGVEWYDWTPNDG
ncbi:hypothetical protein TNCV_936821 [Trichonephila clavipes]|nr:hypothetical protein TNCV_936821 [Trichonephila clavipes]